ncbi:hypothetical protein AtEden1_Chr3g0197731 [Arabidopsis thaliana]
MGFHVTRTFPSSILCADPCRADIGDVSNLKKKVPPELMKKMGTIRSSHDWVATSKDDGILRLQDDLNPVASDRDQNASCYLLYLMPHCQTKIVTKVLTSSSCCGDSKRILLGWAWVLFLFAQISYKKIHNIFKIKRL